MSSSITLAPRLGQFFTPPAVVDFIYDALATWNGLPAAGGRVLDPACGEGIFLRRARERGIAPPEALFGLELDARARTWWRNAGLDEWPNLHPGDGLQDHPDVGITEGSFDLVIGNPPYGFDLPLPSSPSSHEAWHLIGRRGPAPRCPVELLFLERFVQLTRSSGVIAIILPEGVLVNTRYQRFRDRLMEAISPLGIISLPRSTFGAAGANAKTAILLGRRLPPTVRRDTLLLLDPGESGERRESVRGYLRAALGASRLALRAWRLALCQEPPSAKRQAPSAARVRSIAVDRLLGHPWSPEYWDDAAAAVLDALRAGPFPLYPLGELDAAGRESGLIRFTTYGAVGSRSFVPDGVRYLTPRNLTPTGVDFSRQERFVAADGPNDPPRSRLREGDILLSNSGVGCIGRPAIFSGFADATTIAQHVNLIRVEGIDAFYVTAYLHTRFARLQLRRFESGTGAAGLNFAQIRALQIPVPLDVTQAAIRSDYAALHATHLTATRTTDPSLRMMLLEDAQNRLRHVVDALERCLLEPMGSH